MLGFPILSLMLLVPLVGAVLILLIGGEERIVRRNSRSVALIATLFNFILSIAMWLSFDPSSAAFQMVEHHPWIGDNIAYHLGVDGISAAVASLAARMRRLQTGYVYHYAFAMMIGLAIVLTYIVIREGGM